MIESAPLRGQFNSLKALIEAVPTQAELANVLASTSNNTNTVSTLGQAAANLYSQSHMQDVINKLDELINALRR
ncbi:MAG: hypothetical protein IPK22_25090 [Verrucomicrobiaceae bacterium]|nr:hypothetical protein [Verrucomicrobiaceae bacterium]